MAQTTIKNGAGADVAVELPPAPGRAAEGASVPVVLSTEDAAKVPSLGQAARAASVPVALSTEDAAKLPATLGAKAASASLAVTQSTEDAAQIGATNESAAAADDSTSGLNGLTKRMLQRWTTFLTRLPAALGAGGGLKVELYDAAGVALTYVQPASDMTHALVALSTTAAEIMPANAARLYAAVKNTDASIVIYIGDSNAVTSSNGWPLAAGQEKEFPNYVGPIWGIAASATPSAAKIEY